MEQDNPTLILSSFFARCITDARLVYLNQATFSMLAERDEISLRMWMWLESQRFNHGWEYLISASRRRNDRKESCLSDLFRLPGSWSPLQQAKRVLSAAMVISELDPNYALAVKPAHKPGTFKLTAAKAKVAVHRGAPGTEEQLASESALSVAG